MSENLENRGIGQCDNSNCHHEHCTAKVAKSETLSECPNKCATSSITTGQVNIKVPVVLAERSIQVCLESKIDLGAHASEIKRVYKKLFLTQCQLMPESGKLFLGGFVRKNIEFATANVSHGAICGDIRCITVDVPFECCTKVHFTNIPVVRTNTPITEVETFKPEFCSKDCFSSVIGKDECQQNFRSIERFNEKVFCELESAKFEEVNIIKHGTPIPGFPGEQVFEKFTEKMVIKLKLKLLQMQQLCVKSRTPRCTSNVAREEENELEISIDCSDEA